MCLRTSDQIINVGVTCLLIHLDGLIQYICLEKNIYIISYKHINMYYNSTCKMQSRKVGAPGW